MNNKCRVSVEELEHDRAQWSTTVDQDVENAFKAFKNHKDENFKTAILAEAMTENDSVLKRLVVAVEGEDHYLTGQIILEALKDYAHDCATAGTLNVHQS